MVEFTSGQRKTIANGLTALSLVVVISCVGVLVWLVFKVLSYAAPAIVPVLLGFFLALFFRPYYQFWKRLLHNPTLSVLVMLLTVFVPLGLFCWYAGAAVVGQATNLIHQWPQLVDQATTWFRSTFPSLDALLVQMGLDQSGISMLYQKYGTTALKAGSGALKCLSGVLTALVSIVFFGCFVTAREQHGGDIVSHLPFLKVETKAFLAEQVDAFVDILVSFFQRQVIICLVEGTMYGLGFMLVGLPYGFLIGFLLGVLNLIPFLGSLICLPLALPIAYFAHGGTTTRLVLTLVVWGCGQLLDGYLITPKIQGGKTGLGYAGVIFSFFFWSTVLGPLLGMLLAIPLSAFCVVLWRALKLKYIRPVV